MSQYGDTLLSLKQKEIERLKKQSVKLEIENSSLKEQLTEAEQERDRWKERVMNLTEKTN